MPKVSGRIPKYSRFWQTRIGDWVRSALHDRRGSRLGQYGDGILTGGDGAVQIACTTSDLADC